MLKKAKGISKVDDVLDASTDVGTAAKKVDDAATLATAAKKTGLHKFVDKFGGLIQVAMFGSFMLGSYINEKRTAYESENGTDPDVWVTDPESNVYTISKEDPDNIIVGETVEKDSSEILAESITDPKAIAALVLLSTILIYNINSSIKQLKKKI